MNRYWRGTNKRGEFVTEAQGAVWNEVSNDLTSLEMALEDKGIVIKLPDNAEYVQAKTCGADLLTGKCEIESRYIGFILGDKKIIIRVDEKSNTISVEVD